jgi:hypothetical protein
MVIMQGVGMLRGCAWIYAFDMSFYVLTAKG